MTISTATDGYKIGHPDQYHPETTSVHSNWTPRGSRIEGIDHVAFFGQQAFNKKYLIKKWNEFFAMKEEDAVKAYYRRLSNYLPAGRKVKTDRIIALHRLGYLPIMMLSLPEGACSPLRVPQSVIKETLPDFFWLVNYIETLHSCEVWKPCTSATISKEYKKIFDHYAMLTVGNTDFVQWQGHDFSMRGMSGLNDAMASGGAHLLNFTGTDTIPAIDWLEEYYNADCEKELIGGSVPATEHAVMCSSTGFYIWDNHNGDWSYQGEAELAVFERLITEVYPDGIVSIVSDTWDLWKVCTEYVFALKDVILARNGKVVFRPDCYDSESMLFTSGGWKYFKDITNNSFVAQVHDDGHYSLVNPSKIINEEYEGDMYHFTDHHGKIDVLVTPNHRMIYKKFDQWRTETAEEMSPNNWEKKFIRSSAAPNINTGLTFNERLNIAFQADGSYTTSGNKIRFSFSKIRKIERLSAMLDDNDVKYKIYNLQDGRVEFNIDLDASFFSKDFEWVNISELSSNWCKEFIEELSHWDACIRNEGRIKFDTTNKRVVDVVELIALGAGYGCLISERSDIRKEIFSDVYTAHIMKRNTLDGRAVQKNKVQYKGAIHCVSVPTGRLIVKRNRSVTVCGNSGDPVNILCGHPESGKLTWNAAVSRENGVWGDGSANENEFKGVVELLWDVFGGTSTDKGYKLLDSHVGVIYGDSITLKRAKEICERLMAKGFASINWIAGIGSYTYQYQTRDTFGYAQKSTYCEVRDYKIDIFKDPITDDGTKKSARGITAVFKDDKGEYYLKDQATMEELLNCELKMVFKDSKLLIDQSLSEIRERIRQ